MHQASHVDGTSDNLDDSPLELCGNSNEDSLSGRQMDVKSTEDVMLADLSAAEAVEEEPREIAEVLGHLEADSSAEVGNAEKALEILDAEVQDEIDRLEEDVQRPMEEVMANSGEAQELAETPSKESEIDFNFAIEDLKQELRRLEEENRTLKSSSNESSQVMHNVLLESAGMEVEGSKLESENQQHEHKNLELVVELETLKVQLQEAHSSHAQLESETVALRQEEEDKVSRLSSQIVDLQRQLHELEEEHSSALVKSKDLEFNLEIMNDEKIKLNSQVASILEDRQKREEELVGILTDCQEHVHTLEVEQRNFLSTIETSNAAVRQLEKQNAALSSEFDQQKQNAECKISGLASELQITRDQQNELKLQLQGLREENTHVVIKASKLDQLVEELKSDKLRLSSELERLAQERERREEELEAELRTCREQVQSLEAEKVTSQTLVENLITQVRELEEDNSQLTGLSNEASQSVQHLWEENTRLIEGYNRLEQEKQAHEGERMELVAGIQTVWEQLHAANDREALLASELRGLSERKDAEEAFFVQKIKDLESQLEASAQEKSDLSSKSEEVSQVLENLRLETSQALKDLQEEKDQRVNEVYELMKQREEAEQAMSRQQIAWETRVQGLESDKASATSMVEDLEQQLLTSREIVKGLEDKDGKSNQLIQELREEITRLSSEIDKLEEVKERQEGERLELAAELQAAWDQIQAVRDSESNLATELSDLKDLRNEEKLRSDGLVQELRQHIQDLEVKMSEAAIKVEQLSKRLNELRKEQELQDENERLTSEIVMLEQEKERVLTERAALLGETRTLQGRVESLEFDKNKMAFEIEELNQWLQGPAAEKKQLAANLDEMTQLLKGLELERNQLATTVSELQEERERTQKDVGKLQDVINVLEEEKANSLLAHDESIRQLESLEEEKQQAVKIQEDLAHLVQNLNEKIQILEEESTRMVSVRDDSLLRIQGLEGEKIAMEKQLEEQSIGLNQLRMENKEHVDAVVKLQGDLEGSQMEVELLKNQVSSLEDESLRLKTVHQTVLSQLLAMETAKSFAEKSVKEFTDLNSNLMEQLHSLESENSRNIRLQEEVVSMGEEKSQLQQSLEESGLLVQGLHLKNSELTETIGKLEEKLLKGHDEIQRMNGRLSDFEIEKEKYLFQHKELLARVEVMEDEMLDCSKSLDISKSALENLQAENLAHVNKANSLEGELEKRHIEVQRFEEQMKSLSTLHQDALLQLQALVEEKVELTTALDALNSSLQTLEAENIAHSSKAEASEELERRQMELQRYQDTLLQLQILEEEKAELAKSLDASKFTVRELRGQNVEHSERVRMLEEEVAQRQAEVQILEEKVGSLSSAHEDSVLQLQVLREEKAELVNSVDAFNLSIQELQVSNEQYSNTVKILEEDVLRRHADSQRLDKETERLLAAHQDSLLRLQTLEEEKAELVNLLDASNLLVLKLQAENLEHVSKSGSLEEEVERKQAEVQGLEEKIDSLSTIYQDSLLQLQALEEENSELANSRDMSTLCVQGLQDKIVEQTNTVKILENKLAQRQSEVKRLGEEKESLSSAHEDSLLQLEVLEKEKAEFVNSLDAFNLSVQELQSKNEENTNTVKILEDQVVRRQAEVQRLEEHSESLSTAHQSTLLQLLALGEEKDELAKTLHILNLSFQKLQAENVAHINEVYSLEEERKKRLAEIQELEKEVDGLSTAQQGTLLQLQILEEEKVELRKFLDGSDLSVQELQGKNVEHSQRVWMLEEEVAQKQVEVQRLEEESRSLSKAHEDALIQLQQLEVQKSTLTNHLQECECVIQKLHTENSELASAARNLEELYRRRDKIESLDSPVHSLDDKDFREASEYNGVSLQGQSLEDEEAEAARSVEDCNILVKQLELKPSSSFGIKEEGQEQLDFLKADKVKCSKLLEQSELMVKKLESENTELRSTVTKLEKHLRDESQILRDQVQSLEIERESFEQECAAKLRCLEEEKSQLGKALEESNLTIADLHTDIDTLAATVLDLGSGKDELTNQVSLLQERTDDIVAERDQLSSEMQGIRKQVQEYAERLQESDYVAKKSKEEALELAKQLETFREQVSKNKKSNQSRQLETPKQLGSTSKRNRDLVADLEPGLDRQRLSFGQIPTVRAAENKELMGDVESSYQKPPSSHVDKTELEAHVANLSSCLEDSQVQLKALVIKSSTGNPYLLTSRADDGGNRKGLACFSADGNCVLNYGSELKVGRNIKAVDQEKKDKKGNATLPTFTQRTQTPSRSFKKCKVNMQQQPKRRWIF